MLGGVNALTSMGFGSGLLSWITPYVLLPIHGAGPFKIVQNKHAPSEISAQTIT